MAAPNILAVTNIVGKTATVALSTTSATSVLSNASSSGKVLKVNSLIVSNVDGANNASITISLYSAAALAGTLVSNLLDCRCAGEFFFVIIDKDSPIYLEEDKSIGATASAANDLEVICSYEDIS